MKIVRSTKCTLKFATPTKQALLQGVLAEYGRVANLYIGFLWNHTGITERKQLLKSVVDQVADSWLTFRLRKVACREALGLVTSARTLKSGMPIHGGKSMHVSSTIGRLEQSTTTMFDAWLILTSVGQKLRLDLPIKFHRHYHKLAQSGRRLESYIITAKYVQFCFKSETGPKRTEGNLVGIDTGIKSLATLSTGQSFGVHLEQMITRINRCKHSSNHQRQLRRALHQYIDEVVQQLPWLELQLIVVEHLHNITKSTKQKRRLPKPFRKLLGRWNYGYWLRRLQAACEQNRVSFRTVSPYQTSITCSACGHTEKANRVNQGVFRCRSCDHTLNADVNAARNILTRFCLGPYGARFKPGNI